MSRRVPLRTALAAALLAVAAGGASAQQVRTYTESTIGPNFLTYGLPVPLPIESLTPVDGFRSYASVQARLQAFALESSDLSAHDVGRTHAGRTVWAYVASDEDGTDVEGRPEAAFFINASTHAREWATPEVSTGTIERLMAGAGDGGIVRYVLDNTRLVIIPVHNIDGVLQTQRYPTDALVGQDPDFPQDWPRDGRMRRKNMRGVDEILLTTGDHLLGIDLNRNHPPFWATTPSRSSGNVNSLVHHGAAPHSEPENQAILTAAQLGPETRFRLGIDLHSHSRVFYTSNTGRTRLNNVQRNLVARLANHHEAVAGKRYFDIQDPANLGIGTAQEYFSYSWLVPGWTLELEPAETGAAEYGGTMVTHGGFILPASQARRVREGWAETHLLAFYQMSGPPHLARVRYVDVDTGAVARQERWRYDAATARRARIAEVPGSLTPGRRYRAELAFNKPMRWRDAQGAIASIPGTTLPPAAVQATLVQGTARTVLDTAGGAWITDPARTLRYRDDTYAFEFTAPNAVGDYALEVSTADFANANLDSDPSTPADWADGAWSEYENALGNDGDNGGVDRSFTLGVAQPTLLVTRVPALAGEGDAFEIDVQLPAAATGTRVLALARGAGFEPLTTWNAGQTDLRSVRIALDDDAVVQGDRQASVALHFLAADGSSAGLAANVALRVLDNDSSALAVLRGTRGLAMDFAQAPAGAEHALVLDRRDYAGPSNQLPACAVTQFTGPLRVYGNGATLRPGTSGCGGNAGYDGRGGAVELLDLHLAALADPAAAQSASATTLLSGQGALSLVRTRFDAEGQAPATGPAPDVVLLRAENGAVRIAQSRFETQASPDALAGLRFRNADVEFDASYVRDVHADALIALDGGSIALRDATLDAPVVSTGVLALSNGATSTWRGTLAQGSATLCNVAGTSLGFNYLAESTCAPRLESDTHARVPLAFDEGTRRYTYEVSDAYVDAAGNACSALDVRGAPRPQSLTGGVVPPRCDAGAFERGINPYRGIWSPQRAGHGLDIQTTGNRLFVAWYTYEADGEPTAYQASAPFTGPHWQATLQQSSRNPQSGAIALRDVGTITLDFHDATHATLAWRFTGQMQAQEEIAASLFAPGAPRFEVTGLWYPPADSGYGATISRRGEVTAIGVYYYDAEGNVRWALGTGNGADAQEFTMTSFRGFCPDCSTVPVTGTPAGTLTAHFHTPRQARLDMQLVYPGAAGGPWNRSGARFVPLNDPVDNTDALR